MDKQNRIYVYNAIPGIKWDKLINMSRSQSTM